MRQLPTAATAAERDQCIRQFRKRLGSADQKDCPFACAVCNEAIFPTSDPHSVVSVQDFVCLPVHSTSSPKKRGKKKRASKGGAGGAQAKWTGVGRLVEPRLRGKASGGPLAVLEQHELTETVQLVAFHPAFCFADTAFDDPSNGTNRSPAPMVHLLRRGDVAALTVDGAAFSERNAAILRSHAATLSGGEG